jgi:hypothetical protein
MPSPATGPCCSQQVALGSAEPALSIDGRDASWAAIRQAEIPLVLEARSGVLTVAECDRLLAAAPFTDVHDGPFATVADAFAHRSRALATDIATLAHRFAVLIQVDRVKVRLEGVTTDACTKLHADYTGVRLITTDAGPGTDYAPDGDTQAPLARVPTGWIGLFKGKAFAPGHLPCLHRSPPIAATGTRRLLLVIDTSRPDADGCCPH